MQTNETQNPIRVIIVGANGKMGREASNAFASDPAFDVVALVARQPGHGIETDIQVACAKYRFDVLIDLSHASVSVENALCALQAGAAVVSGVTGHSSDQIQAMRDLAEQLKLPVMLAPNFAIGAVLMMRFAAMAAKWIPDVEVIEMHHDRKEDAPSGTALKTIEGIAQGRTLAPTPRPTDVEKVKGARGGVKDDVHVHSVRLPGLLAHQTVMFGGPGEVLSIRHDAMNRSVYMQGLKLCVSKVRDLEGLVIGMDQLLFEV